MKYLSSKLANMNSISIKTIDISHGLTTDIISIFSSSLKHFTNLEELIMNNNIIGSGSFTSFYENLQYVPKLKKLNISCIYYI